MVMNQKHHPESSPADLESRRLVLVDEIAKLKAEILDMIDENGRTHVKSLITRHEHEIARMEDELYFHKNAA